MLDKSTPSARHVSLLCDKMNCQGDFMSVNRFGLKKENIGPLAKCSFEQTTDQLRLASMFGEFDNIKGVSSNIMVGQIPSCGTGESEILLDEEMLATVMEEAVAQPSLETPDHPSFDEFMKVDPTCASASTIKFSLTNVEGDDMDFAALPTFTL